MKKYLILLLLISCETEEPNYCFKMIRLSDALPIQFWRNGEPSFNQKEEAGVTHVCFFKPFNCEDEIKFQGIDDEDGQEYSLLIKDEDDELLETIELDEEVFTKTVPISLQFSTTEFSSGLGDWVNANGSDRSSAAVWIPGSTPTSARAYSGVGGSLSKYFAIQRNDGSGRGWPPGNYAIELAGQNLSTFSDPAQNLGMGLYGLNNLTSQTQIMPTNSPGNLPTGGTPNTITFEFTLSVYYEYLAVTLGRLGPPGGFDLDGRIISIEITEAPTEEENVFNLSVFSKSFTFSDYDLCGGRYKLELVNQDEEIIWFTDYMNIQPIHTSTLLIKYSNPTDYAGLVYEGLEEFSEFGIRVKAKFYEERFPEENESEPDGEGNVDKLSSTTKTQRLLEIDPLPPYEHKKLKLALQHNTIYIQNFAWVKEEAYEIEKIAEKYPFFKAKAWLTLQSNEFILNA